MYSFNFSQAFKYVCMVLLPYAGMASRFYDMSARYVTQRIEDMKYVWLDGKVTYLAVYMNGRYVTLIDMEGFTAFIMYILGHPFIRSFTVNELESLPKTYLTLAHYYSHGKKHKLMYTPEPKKLAATSKPFLYAHYDGKDVTHTLETFVELFAGNNTYHVIDLMTLLNGYYHMNMAVCMERSLTVLRADTMEEQVFKGEDIVTL